MLSDDEIKKIHRELQSQQTSKGRRNLKKRLIEHEYATNLPPFTPAPHQQLYMNRFTSKQTLEQIMEAAQRTTSYTLDTESVNVFKQGNRPALIQIQMILSNTKSTVLLIEMNHLPPTSSETFEQIRQICRIVFDPRNTIYTWGKITELDDFVPFRLFTSEQVHSPINRDLQQEFKAFWQKIHPHQSNTRCECESCLGKNANEPWSLQDAVAHQLKLWLDKRFTRSSFDMGLDPAFSHSSLAQRQRQQNLTAYAANDCLSMSTLVRAMNHTHTHISTRDELVEPAAIEPIDHSFSTERNVTAGIHGPPAILPLAKKRRIDHPYGHHTTLTISIIQHSPVVHDRDDSLDIEPRRNRRRIVERIDHTIAPSSCNEHRVQIDESRRPHDWIDTSSLPSERSHDRNERTDRTERFHDRTDRNERSHDRTDRNERSHDRTDRNERSHDRTDRNERFHDRTDRNEPFHDRTDSREQTDGHTDGIEQTHGPHGNFQSSRSDERDHRSRHRISQYSRQSDWNYRSDIESHPSDDRNFSPNDDDERRSSFSQTNAKRLRSGEHRSELDDYQSESNHHQRRLDAFHRTKRCDQTKDDSPDRNGRSNRIVHFNPSDRTNKRSEDRLDRPNEPDIQCDRPDQHGRINQPYRIDGKDNQSLANRKDVSTAIGSQEYDRFHRDSHRHGDRMSCNNCHELATSTSIDRSDRHTLANNIEQPSINDSNDRTTTSIGQHNGSGSTNRNDRSEIARLRALTANTEEGKKNRNRLCTIKQRARQYKTEIIRRGIDHRFSITLVKEILRRHKIPFTAINIAKSRITHRKSLYIGTHNTPSLPEHEFRTRHLFTTEAYNEHRARQRH